MTATTNQPGAAVDRDPQCATCPGTCRRSSHAWVNDGANGYRYVECRVHRRCTRFEPAEPEPAEEPSTPPGVDEAGAASSVVPAPATEQPANRGAGEVVEADDPQASTTAKPTLLIAYDSWGCSACGSRRFQPDTCCGQPLEPIRVEIHRRTL